MRTEGISLLFTNILRSLLEWQGTFHLGGHLLVATSMVSGDKTVRALAAELWIQGVNQGTLDSEKIGRILGEQAQIGFAPLQRLTHLLTEHLLRLSNHHQQELEAMLAACIALLPEKPLRGQRKIMEIYQEVIGARQFAFQENSLLRTG